MRERRATDVFAIERDLYVGYRAVDAKLGGGCSSHELDVAAQESSRLNADTLEIRCVARRGNVDAVLTGDQPRLAQRRDAELGPVHQNLRTRGKHRQLEFAEALIVIANDAEDLFSAVFGNRVAARVVQHPGAIIPIEVMGDLV